MRFFSNEAQDNAAEQDDRSDGVPSQRAGSPWHDTPPADRTDEPADRPGEPVDHTGEPVKHTDETGAHRDSDDDDTTKIDDVRRDDDADTTQPIGAHESAVDRDENPTTPWDRAREEDRDADALADEEERAEREEAAGKDDDTVDAAIEDRGTFEDPQVEDAEPVVAVATVPAAAEAGTGTTSGPAPFFPEAETQPLRDRWREIQLRFVDDPKATTGEAAALVDETIEKLTTSLRQHRGSLASGGDDTEALRVELRAYRDILDRLLGL
ncbi:hypothetical protein GCM10010168_15960 [Actinoplanes ianthinogenes]|uniref:Uncharacterized protein n=1 Tax=Actinoplanes ianthinogenes TaxID=122358 RepID=A0ABM7LZM6_9ACTN|nr:hypothetical protein [Actinoplanes ianthinogenes]BCJ44783.1 hypothetical protein Aiant_54400 [Actinoplanes ianthinogenes]GGQ99953.1 hypothetical protein GCM10010168_15960 [Actinoplanes ianthinogenes]